MSVELNKLVAYLDDYLLVNRIKDYCPNGLQVEGSQRVSKIIGGVTASLELIEEAVDKNADAILVHHGYFWKGEDERISGIKKKRIKALLENEISLLAYHLPLDVHDQVGNNVELAKQLDLTVTGPLEPLAAKSVGLVGEVSEPVTLDDFAKRVSDRLGRECMAISGGGHQIKRVAWCTGAAQSMIDKAIDQGADLYLSGEISEPTVHIAKEAGIHYISAGHHATERYGVMALGRELADQFNITFEFVDKHNPV